MGISDGIQRWWLFNKTRMQNMRIFWTKQKRFSLLLLCGALVFLLIGGSTLFFREKLFSLFSLETTETSETKENLATGGVVADQPAEAENTTLSEVNNETLPLEENPADIDLEKFDETCRPHVASVIRDMEEMESIEQSILERIQRYEEKLGEAKKEFDELRRQQDKRRENVEALRKSCRTSAPASVREKREDGEIV